MSALDIQHQIRILCFGDSNTWGYDPKDGSRYSGDIRWTGVLQKLLGNDYRIIEEGLNGRTTDLDYPDRVGKNGKAYLIPCLDSHHPLDYIILSLGPNDMKSIFGRPAQKISEAIDQLIAIVKGAGLEKPTAGIKIILVGPPIVKEGIGIYGDTMKGATRKSQELIPLLRKVAEKNNLIFLSLFDRIEPSPIDGVHFSEDAHEKIGRIIHDVICANSRVSSDR